MHGLSKTILVTTSLQAGNEQQELAHRLGAEIGASLTPRDNLSLEALLGRHGADGVIVVESGRVFFTDGRVEFFFHPGLAVLRIAEIQKGKNDQMIAAMDLKAGHSVLDCTLGLGNDALVAGYVAGENGRILGLESSPVIAALVSHGMRTYSGGSRAVRASMRRIEIKCADHRDFLAGLSPDSYDVVYFDPMFSSPLTKSSGINSLRPLADHRPITPEAITLALAVARKRVVVKDNRQGSHLRSLGIARLTGGKSSSVVYGILPAQ